MAWQGEPMPSLVGGDPMPTLSEGGRAQQGFHANLVGDRKGQGAGSTPALPEGRGV